MKFFSFTDVSKTPGEVLDEALKGPIVLKKRGKAKLVVLPAEDYDRLMGRPQTTAHSIYDTDSETGRELARAIDETLAEPGDDPK
jgi:prevent-host-death family protein